jgi:hypothetical protein
MSNRVVLSVSLLILATFFQPERVFSQGLRFDSETVIIRVRPDHIRVDGSYTILNDTPVDRPQRLYYPFPVDSLHPTARDIEVAVGDSVVAFTRSETGILFSIPLPAQEPATFRVAYTQDCLESTGCYILMTTSAWNAPLREARFEVHVPNGIEIVTASYEFDSVEDVDGTAVHRMMRRNFLPDTDLCFRWRPADR